MRVSFDQLTVPMFQDKLEKISDLLSGNQVRAGENRFTAAEHPLGIKFCTFLLAKKFIVSVRRCRG